MEEGWWAGVKSTRRELEVQREVKRVFFRGKRRRREMAWRKKLVKIFVFPFFFPLFFFFIFFVPFGLWLFEWSWY